MLDGRHDPSAHVGARCGVPQLLQPRSHRAESHGRRPRPRVHGHRRSGPGRRCLADRRQRGTGLRPDVLQGIDRRSATRRHHHSCPQRLRRDRRSQDVGRIPVLWRPRVRSAWQPCLARRGRHPTGQRNRPDRSPRWPGACGCPISVGRAVVEWSTVASASLPHGIDLATWIDGRPELAASAPVQRRLASTARDLGEYRIAAARFRQFVVGDADGKSVVGPQTESASVADVQQAANCLARAGQLAARQAADRRCRGPTGDGIDRAQPWQPSWRGSPSTSCRVVRALASWPVLSSAPQPSIWPTVTSF